MADAAQVRTWNYIKNVIPRTQGAMVQFSFYIRKRILLTFHSVSLPYARDIISKEGKLIVCRFARACH